MHIRPCLCIIEDDRLLLLRYNYGGQTVYGIPGGNPEEGESLRESLVRELKEELNLATAPGELLLMAETSRPEKTAELTLHCLFEGRILKGAPLLNPAETSAEAAEWVPIDELENLHLYPNLGRFLLQSFRGHSTRGVYLGRVVQPWV